MSAFRRGRLQINSLRLDSLDPPSLLSALFSRVIAIERMVSTQSRSCNSETIIPHIASVHQLDRHSPDLGCVEPRSFFLGVLGNGKSGSMVLRGPLSRR